MPDLATLAEHARGVEADHVEHVLPALSRAGGSSGGARPTIVAGWHESGAIVDAFVPLPPGYRHALIKFAARSEPTDAPLVEAACLAMAKLAGLEVTAHRIHTLPELRVGEFLARQCGATRATCDDGAPSHFPGDQPMSSPAAAPVVSPARSMRPNPSGS